MPYKPYIPKRATLPTRPPYTFFLAFSKNIGIFVGYIARKMRNVAIKWLKINLTHININTIYIYLWQT